MAMVIINNGVKNTSAFRTYCSFHAISWPAQKQTSPGLADCASRDETLYDIVADEPGFVQHERRGTHFRSQLRMNRRVRETHKPDSRLHYRKFIKLGPAKKVEVLAEEGRIEVDRFDLWKRTWPKDWEPCATANSG